MRINKIVMMLLSLSSTVLFADPANTERIPYFNNAKVDVWKTIIYPSQQQILKLHRHDHDRVLVAFNDGILKVTSDKGEVHYLKLEKQMAYYLAKDKAGELHTVANGGEHPLELVVIELR